MHLFFQHNNQAPTYQASIHPAVKSFVGKRPKKVFDNQQVSQDDANAPNEEKTELDTLKVPRYIPPKIPGKIITAPVRGAERYCQLKKLVVGNVSRWIPVSDRDDCDKASHKWMVFIKFCFVVDFILNKSYIFFCRSMFVAPKKSQTFQPLLMTLYFFFIQVIRLMMSSMLGLSIYILKLHTFLFNNV